MFRTMFLLVFLSSFPWLFQVPWASSGSSGSCASSRCQVSPGAHCSPCCWIRSGLESGWSWKIWVFGVFLGLRSWLFLMIFIYFDAVLWIEILALPSHLDSENSQSWLETNLPTPVWQGLCHFEIFGERIWVFTNISIRMKLNVAVSVEVKS